MAPTRTRAARAVVVGGGMAGLAAAVELRRQGAAVTVLEATERLGGVVHATEVGGVLVDAGADAMLRRAPEGVALAAWAGLEVVAPETTAAHVLTPRGLRPLPGRTLLGVPGALRPLAASGVLGVAGLARVASDRCRPGRPLLPADGPDTSVARLVCDRLGPQVLDRLVDPLLGGVYAGRSELLSARATLPQLAPALTGTASLVRAVAAALPAPDPLAGSPFGGVRGGMGLLPPALGAALRADGADVRLGARVTDLRRTPGGWEVRTAAGALAADVVVLALPAAPAARLLAPHLPHAAADLAAVETASVALVTLVLDGPVPGSGSGYLVPPSAGRAVKAVTATSRKWGHLAAGPGVLRASLGRYGDAAVLQRDDDELVALVRSEVGDVLGPLPAVRATRVTRWGGALPQYAPGHVERVARLRAAVATLPGLAVAGASYDGVGVPTVVRTGQRAAREALAGVRGPEWGA